MYTPPTTIPYNQEGLRQISHLLHLGEITLIGARPGMGKTNFAFDLAAHAMPKDGHLLTYQAKDESPDVMMSFIQKLLNVAPKPIRMLIIDEIQLMRYSAVCPQGTPVEFHNFFPFLKQIAREYSIPVIVLAKWPRLCEYRDDHRPQLADLARTDVTPNNFDTILLLYRDSYYYWDEETIQTHPPFHDDMEVRIVKRYLTPCDTKT